MNETLVTILISLVLVAVTVIPYLRRFRAKESKARERLTQMKISGLQEATMVHPQIDALQCIGCAACVRACPEGDVLGIIDGKATLIHGAKCIGHGLCAEACPVGAIELLMAKPGRNADLPLLSEQFETSVPGIYIVGELGGLGLIKNAVQQGVAVIEHIAAKTPASGNDCVDVVIVGAGPSGFAAGLKALERGLRYVILEQNDIGGTVLQYPRAKIVMTSPVELPLWGPVRLRETRKEALLELWSQVMEKTGLKVTTGEKVTGIVRKENVHIVTTQSGKTFNALSVVLALGRRGTPRKLGVPGEERSKVTYRLMDTSSYCNVHLLVVGGGDSAIEAAVGLSTQTGNTVTLSYRKSEFTRIKERNRKHLDDAVKRNRITVLYESEVTEIGEQDVTVKTPTGTLSLKNDYTFIFAGGESPNEFLKSVGIDIHQRQIS
ncbi:MAG: NAD(P)-binding domain-containing protein [Bacteroidota bacterium]